MVSKSSKFFLSLSHPLCFTPSDPTQQGFPWTPTLGCYPFQCAHRELSFPFPRLSHHVLGKSSYSVTAHFLVPSTVLVHSGHQIKYLSTNEVLAHIISFNKSASQIYDDYQVEEHHKKKNNEESQDQRDLRLGWAEWGNSDCYLNSTFRLSTKKPCMLAEIGGVGERTHVRAGL